MILRSLKAFFYDNLLPTPTTKNTGHVWPVFFVARILAHAYPLKTEEVLQESANAGEETQNFSCRFGIRAGCVFILGRSGALIHE